LGEQLSLERKRILYGLTFAPKQKTPKEKSAAFPAALLAK
jgi:hypothetical protein